MSAESSTSRFHTPGKVRWRRFAIVAVPAVAVAGILVGLTAEGAIANLIVDAGGQTGSVATFHNISIGLDAGTLTEDPGTTGTAGTFGEQADSVTIDNLNQDTWLTTAGTFTLPDLSLSFGGSC
jgi:hypothetical protein